MNRKWFLKELLHTVVGNAYNCGNHKGSYSLHVKEWKDIMSDDDLTIMNLLETLQILHINYWQDEPDAMFSFWIDFDEFDLDDLSTILEDKAVNKILRPFMSLGVF